MQVISPNDVKIYNLSAGKSLPEWLSDRKKRKLQKNIDIRRRIELIQDFEMPGVSDTIQITKDGMYAIATGVYSPRMRCYDLSNLSMKFERGFDAEIVKFEILSEDYSKIVFLQCDRHVEFHAAYGKYYRTRIPKFGRDMKYHYPSCDLFVVGASPEIWRLNLEQGRFLNSFVTDAPYINCCDINNDHHLLVCGTCDGRVEAWDPRTRERAAVLDCALTSLTQDIGLHLQCIPSVTALKFRDSLTLGVGTLTGHILLYDIRSTHPLVVKDHMYGLPIQDIEFHQSMDLVLSVDPRVLKIWHQDSGKQYTAIESSSEFNDLCTVPGTGLMFLANEEKKIQTYYIPSLGPAPKWCSFLDTITEELEESDTPTVYDDYKFVTIKDLEELGLVHLVGSSLVRAYMHGYFLDIRLYHKAKAMADPFAFSEYRKSKIQQKIEEERKNRVSVQKLPKVNQDLAKKLMSQKEETSGKIGSSILEDERFKELFTNPDFQVNSQEDEYKLMQPRMSKLEKKSQTKVADDDKDPVEPKQPKFFQMRSGESFSSLNKLKFDSEKKQATLGERLVKEAEPEQKNSSFGSREFTFELKKKKKASAQEAAKTHLMERKKLRRAAGSLHKKLKPR